MAHFAEIDENNIVTRVVVIPDEQEDRGQEYLSQDLGLGGTWLKTSYNTRAGVHALGGTPYRLNYASPGSYYDAQKDVFIQPKPYPSFVLDEATGSWLPPFPSPENTETVMHVWDESIVNWKAIEIIR